jgi:hypothetical protein
LLCSVLRVIAIITVVIFDKLIMTHLGKVPSPITRNGVMYVTPSPSLRDPVRNSAEPFIRRRNKYTSSPQGQPTRSPQKRPPSVPSRSQVSGVSPRHASVPDTSRTLPPATDRDAIIDEVSSPGRQEGEIDGVFSRWATVAK